MAFSSEHARAGHTLVVIVLLTVVFSAATATPAAAHSNPAHYVTKVTSIDPAIPGVHIGADTDGSYLTVTNPTRRTVIVLGYDHEPYLKITANGVWHNTHSRTAYRNGDLANTPSSPAATASPTWDQIANSGKFRFHDQRLHWTGDSPPSAVTQEPRKRHLLKTWTIDLLVDDTPVTVTGTLTWYPGDNHTAWLAFGLISTIVLVGFVIAIIRDEKRKTPIGASHDRASFDSRWS